MVFKKKTFEKLNDVDLYFKEYLPEDILDNYNLLDIQTTIKTLHYPEDHLTLKQARYRIFFDKLLKVQLLSQLNKLEYQE
jgi:ATP-dependent DNA helicase RecG